MNSYSWELIRQFLKVAELGSLSATAKALNISQPTLSRQIQRLEQQTKLNLFQRSTQGLTLTREGEQLLSSAKQMADAADRFDRRVKGTASELSGDIRISASDTMGTLFLPPALTAFQTENPQVKLELVISNSASNLSRRDADIAIRMFKPTQVDLVCRRLPDMTLGFFGHQCYLSRHGEPTTLAELAQFRLIGFDRDSTFITAAGELGVAMTRDDFSCRTDNLLCQLALLRSGAGIGVTHTRIAGRYPELVPVLTQVKLPALECWLACHPDLQFNTSIKALMQFLGQWFAEDPYQRILL